MDGFRYDLKHIYRRDHGICHLCLENVLMSEASRDHLIARYDGGYDSPNNLKLAHKACNHARGAMPMALVVDALAPVGPKVASEAPWSRQQRVCSALRFAAKAWHRANIPEKPQVHARQVQEMDPPVLPIPMGQQGRNRVEWDNEKGEFVIVKARWAHW